MRLALFALPPRGRIKRDGALELGRPNARIDSRRVDAAVTEQGADLLEVVVLLEHFHRSTVAQIVGLQLRDPEPTSVDLAEPPDVLTRHRRPHLADAAVTPARKEQRCELLDPRRRCSARDSAETST